MKIEVVNISKKYGKTNALDDVSFTSSLEILGIVGPNGAGKTTLFNVLTGMIKSDSGKVLLNGIEIDKVDDQIKNKIGYFPQDFEFYPELTGMEVLEFMCSLKGLGRKEWSSEIEHIIDLMGMENLLDIQFGNMSKGMKQKAGIAAILLGNPELIIVDEPTSGLDPAERVRFRNMISTLSSKKTIMFSTHIISDIESICENLLVINKGNLLFKGKTTELITEYAPLIYESDIAGELCEIVNKKYTVLRNTSKGNGLFHSVILSNDTVDQYGFCLKKNVTLEEAYLSLIIKNE